MIHNAEQRSQYELKRLADPSTGIIPKDARLKELAFVSTLPSDAMQLTKRSGVTWVNRGPYNVGGRTRAFAVDVNNENRLLAGSVSGGMWLSEDGGATWKATESPSALKNVTCLTQDIRPGHTHVWYYGSGEAYGASPSAPGAYFLGDGLFKSVDSGKSWKSISSTSGGNQNTFSQSWQLVWNLAIDYSAPDSVEEIYSANYNAIYRSINGGETWTAVRTSASYFTDVAVTSSGVVYATLSSEGLQKGIWRSEDGINFTQITPQNFPSVYRRIVIGINPSNENEVYFLANTPDYGKKTLNSQGNAEWNSFFRYTFLKDNGQDTNGVWENLTQNLPSSGGPFDKWLTQGSYNMVVKVMPNNPNTVFIGGTNLYRSDNAFNDSLNTTFIGGYAQYSKLPIINSYPNHHPDQHVLFFHPNNPNILFSANDGGVFKTLNCLKDSVEWISLNNGYLTAQFYTVAIDHASTNNIIIGGTQDNGSWFVNSANVKEPWAHPRGGDGSYCAIEDGSNRFYFSIQNGKMMTTTLDPQGNKIAYARIDPIGMKGVKFINPYALDPADNNVMYLAGGKYLWRNHHLSEIPLINNWDSISINWTRWNDSVPVPNGKISAIAVSKIPANIVYYGTDNRRVYKVTNAHQGTPKPVDITSFVQTAPFPPGANVSCVAVNPNNADQVIVAFSNYNVQSLFYSENGGTSWTRIGGNLEPTNGMGPSVRWVTFHPVSDGLVYLVGTSVGLFAANALNGPQTEWVLQGANSIGNAVVDMIDSRSTDGLIVVATHANGIYSSKILSVSDVVSAEDYYLANNMQWNIYPNPNASSFVSIKSNEKAKLWKWELLDECGRILLKENASDSSPEAFEKTIDISSLNNGVYYVRILSKNIHYSKILLIQ